jgi:hypothetical protein
MRGFIKILFYVDPQDQCSLLSTQLRQKFNLENMNNLAQYRAWPVVLCLSERHKLRHAAPNSMQQPHEHAAAALLYQNVWKRWKTTAASPDIHAA